MAQQDLQENVSLYVFGATYGDKDVSEKVRKMINGNVLEFTANNDTFGDPWEGTKKSCVVVYSYYVNDPVNGVFKTQTAFVREDDKLTITPASIWPEYYVPSTNKEGLLYIYGAVYGGGNKYLGEVTGIVTALVKDNSLEFTANNDTFGDPWEGTTKSFSLVYSYSAGTDGITVVATKENGDVRVAPPNAK